MYLCEKSLNNGKSATKGVLYSKIRSFSSYNFTYDHFQASFNRLDKHMQSNVGRNSINN